MVIEAEYRSFEWSGEDSVAAYIARLLEGDHCLVQKVDHVLSPLHLYSIDYQGGRYRFGISWSRTNMSLLTVIARCHLPHVRLLPTYQRIRDGVVYQSYSVFGRDRFGTRQQSLILTIGTHG